MLDEDFARIRARRNNVHRYRRPLETKLSDLVRQYNERRLTEELSKVDELSASVVAITFPKQTSPIAAEIQA